MARLTFRCMRLNVIDDLAQGHLIGMLGNGLVQKARHTRALPNVRVVLIQRLDRSCQFCDHRSSVKHLDPSSCIEYTDGGCSDATVAARATLAPSRATDWCSLA